MKNTLIDNFLKCFFIGSSIFYFVSLLNLISTAQPFFETLISFLIESVAAYYFIKKSNLLWVKENVFFLLCTITGLMLTKTFFFFYHDMDYQLSAIISGLLIFSSSVAFKRYTEDKV